MQKALLDADRAHESKISFCGIQKGHYTFASADHLIFVFAKSSASYVWRGPGYKYEPWSFWVLPTQGQHSNDCWNGKHIC